MAVPASLVKNKTEYSRDPKVLYAWRNQLGQLLDRAEAADANPWGDNFGVRGFPAK